MAEAIAQYVLCNRFGGEPLRDRVQSCGEQEQIQIEEPGNWRCISDDEALGLR
jgi:hypothetical protein